MGGLWFFARFVLYQTDKNILWKKKKRNALKRFIFIFSQNFLLRTRFAIFITINYFVGFIVVKNHTLYKSVIIRLRLTRAVKSWQQFYRLYIIFIIVKFDILLNWQNIQCLSTRTFSVRYYHLSRNVDILIST